MKLNAAKKSNLNGRAAAHSTLFSSLDYERINKCLRSLDFSNYGLASMKDYARALKQKLEHSQIVEPEEVPQDVVTMHSQVLFTESGSKSHTSYTIVYPQEANIDENRISVLSPIGSFLIGLRVNDVGEIYFPYGPKKYRIEKLMYQPEASGNYDL